MPKLIKLHNGHADWANDAFVTVGDEDPTPGSGGVILPFDRFKTEGDGLLDDGRNVGVLVQPDTPVEVLSDDLPRLSVVAVNFPKFRDGRGYSSARLLRERYGYGGEIRAVGEVLREQAAHFVRCGFDAFEPADGSSPEQWMAAASRFRHVYQRGADDRQPAFAERNS
jgi:uncharacterized protein (DUF934 family)